MDETSWQPIETAPRDGTPVLLYFPDYDQPIQVGYYAIIETTRNGRCVSSDEYWCGKWNDNTRFIRSVAFMEDVPTHWLPLPDIAPPEIKEEDDWGDDRGFDDMSEGEEPFEFEFDPSREVVETKFKLSPGVVCTVTRDDDEHC